MKHFHKQRISPSYESGAVLIVGLVMVLLISIVSLSAIRSSNLQEAMAGNMRDRNMAFQAAESALVVGEAIVNVLNPAPVCSGRASCFLRHAQLPQNSVIYLSDVAFDGLARESGLVLAGVETEPTFMIEELAKFKPADGSGQEQGGGGSLTELVPYRISAKGTGLGANSSVILLTTYNRFAE